MAATPARDQGVVSAALGYGYTIASTLVGLLLTPFVIGALGDAQYGVYLLIGSLITALTLVDLGLGNAITRFVARYRAAGDLEGEGRFNALVAKLYLAIALLVLAGGWAATGQVDRWFAGGLDPAEADTARTLFAILVVNLAVMLPNGALTALCMARQHFIWPRATLIARLALRVVLVLAILSGGGGAVALALIDTGLNIALLAANIFYVVRRLRPAWTPASFDPALARRILGYSGWIFLFVIVGKLQWNVGQLILGARVDAVAVAIYGVGIMLGTFYAGFGSAVSQLMLPKAATLVEQGANPRVLTDMMIASGRANLLLLFPVLAGFALYGRLFMDLWVGPAYASAYWIALLVMLAYTLPLVQSFANALLEAYGLFAFKALAYLVPITIGYVIGTMLLPRDGMIGLAAWSIGGWMVGQALVNIYYSRRLQLGLMRFFAATLLRLLPLFGLTLAAGLLFDRLLPGGWAGLAARTVLLVFTYVALALAVGIDADERSALREALPVRRRHVRS